MKLDLRDGVMGTGSIGVELGLSIRRGRDGVPEGLGRWGWAERLKNWRPKGLGLEY